MHISQQTLGLLQLMANQAVERERAARTCCIDCVDGL